MKILAKLLSPLGGITMGCVVLTGCVPAAFVAGGATAGAVLTEPRQLETIASDESINYQINKKLMADTELASQAHITATVYNRVVLLTGQAYNETFRQRAIHYAESTAKVKRVFDQITVGVPTSPWRRTQDASLTAAARTRLLAAKGLRSNQFKLVTENGTVYILGIATKKQAAQATSVVQDTPGVHKVVRLIELVRV